jgi:hypothetical protein
MTMGARLEDALILAASKFRGVVDKAGQPYVLHLLRVMLRLPTDQSRQVALLHDVVEDTDITLADLRLQGFSDEVVAAVDALTHRSGEEYFEYVLRLSECELARQVKIADIEDNYRLDRVAYRCNHQVEDAQRIQRYILSYQFLMGQFDQVEYVVAMQSIDAK